MAKNGRLPSPFPYQGLYYVRRRVPKDLRPHYKGEFFMRSLGTSSPVEAASKFPAANAAADAEFDRMRQSYGTWPVDPTALKEALVALIDQYMAALSDHDKSLLRFVFDQDSLALHEFDERFDLWPEKRRSAFARRLADEAAEGRAPLPLPVQTELYRLAESKLRNLLRPFHVRFGADRAERRKFTPETELPNLEITLKGLIDRWRTSKKRPRSTVDELTQTVVDFEQVYGAIAAAEVTRADLDDFSVRLGKLPRNLSRSERALPMNDRITLGEGRTKIVAATIGKKLTLLKALLSFAHGKGILPSNAGHRLATGSGNKTGNRDQFIEAEITSLFKLPIMLHPGQWRYDRVVSDVTLAWLLLFGLTAGPRLKETGQTELVDVIRDGAACALEVTDRTARQELDAIENSDEPFKSVKSEASRRYLMVHRRLLDLGFDNFVAAMRRAGATALFPDLWVHGGPSTKEASRSLNRLIDIVTPSPFVCYHSNRHTWLAATDETDMKDRLVRQLSGHAARDENEKYGRAYLKTMAKGANKLHFDMVDWEALISAWANIDWDAVAGELVRQAASKTNRAAHSNQA